MAYVRKIRERSRKQSDESFLEEIREWQNGATRGHFRAQNCRAMSKNPREARKEGNLNDLLKTANVLNQHSSAENAESFFRAFKRLRKQEQDAVFKKMMKDRRIREELEDWFDLSLSIERMKQPSRPLQDVLKEIDFNRAKKRVSL